MMTKRLLLNINSLSHGANLSQLFPLVSFHHKLAVSLMRCGDNICHVLTNMADGGGRYNSCIMSGQKLQHRVSGAVSGA